MRTVKLTPEMQSEILEKLLKRSPHQYSEYEATVRDILDHVRAEGDAAVFSYTEKFDHFALNAEKREWEEIKLNEDISNPGRYIDAEGRLYLQFRNDTQDMYADIPTPLINLEGRLEHAEN